MAAGGFSAVSAEGGQNSWLQYAIPFLECTAIWGCDSQVSLSLLVRDYITTLKVFVAVIDLPLVAALHRDRCSW